MQCSACKSDNPIRLVETANSAPTETIARRNLFCKIVCFEFGVSICFFFSKWHVRFRVCLIFGFMTFSLDDFCLINLPRSGFLVLSAMAVWR